MKHAFLLLIFFFCLSCKTLGNIEDIDDLWQNVKSSKNSLEEELAIEKVWVLILNNDISFEALAKNTNGDLTNIQNLPDNHPIKTVTIIFTSGHTKKTYEWTPIDINNVFVFYRE